MTKTWRRLRMGAQTLTGLRAQGFFLPYRHADEIPRPAPRSAAIEARIEAARPDFEALLDAMAAHGEALRGLGGPAPLPRWEQDWFPRLDGAAAWTLARTVPPARIVEVGSGHSTRFLAHAVAAAGARCAQTCIDPAPRARLLDLPVAWRRKVLGPEDMDLFDALGPGDMAVFDSSHLLMPGSDVDLILNAILPRLARGVRIHVHDVFLPDDYPADWAWRGYNEQNGLAPWLLSGAMRPIWASAFAATRMEAGARDPIRDLPWAGAPESSLWLLRD